MLAIFGESEPEGDCSNPFASRTFCGECRFGSIANERTLIRRDAIEHHPQKIVRGSNSIRDPVRRNDAATARCDCTIDHYAHGNVACEPISLCDYENTSACRSQFVQCSNEVWSFTELTAAAHSLVDKPTNDGNGFRRRA